MEENPRQSWIQDSRYWIPVSLSVELGFRIDFNCQWDSEFLELYSVFQTLNFQIPQEKISGLISLIPESGLPYIGAIDKFKTRLVFQFHCLSSTPPLFSFQ